MLRVSVLIVIVALTGCSGGGGSATPTGPTPAASTRVIGVSGNLAFGEVLVGGSRELSFSITNSGNSTLTVSGMSLSGGLANVLSASWTGGAIAAGGSQNVVVRFEPTAQSVYSGTLTVNGDQTSGANTLAVSGTGAAAFGGTWIGQYIVERCDGTGSAQDVVCSTRGGAFPPGSSLPIRIALTQSGNTVNGTVSFGQVTGPVNGVITGDGTLVLQGTATGGILRAQISTWSTRVQGNSMVGNVAYNMSLSTLPGTAVLVARLSGVTRQ